ncbi:MAG: hypothetical protein VB093_07250 [Propionicimonas sp.]|nr:hypothetical protein [Propionicimonas sp.]
MAEVSPNRLRARRLLLGGLAGGHIAGFATVVVFGFASGLVGALSAAVAAVVVIAFFTIGQGVQVVVADAEPRVVLISALASYAFRVSVLGVLLMVVLGNPVTFAALDRIGLVVATIATVIGWLVGEFWVFARLRIPVYDSTEGGITT